MRRQKDRANPTTIHKWIAFTGFLFCLILTTVTASGQKASPVQSGWQATNSCDAIPIYSGMSTDSYKLKLLLRGDPVIIDLEIIGPDGTWCAVREPGQKKRLGYVRSECLEWDRPVATATRIVESPPNRSSANFDIETFQGAEVITPKRSAKDEMKEEVDRAVDAKLNSLIRMSQPNTIAPPNTTYAPPNTIAPPNTATLSADVEFIQDNGYFNPYVPGTFGRRPIFRRPDGTYYYGIPGPGIPPLGNGSFGNPFGRPFPDGGFVRITGGGSSQRGGFSHRR